MSTADTYVRARIISAQKRRQRPEKISRSRNAQTRPMCDSVSRDSRGDGA